MPTPRQPQALTDEQYRQQGSSRCPLCRSSDIEADAIEVDGSNVYQDTSCRACHAEYTDRYELMGYQVTRNPAAPPERAGPGHDEEGQ